MHMPNGSHACADRAPESECSASGASITSLASAGSLASIGAIGEIGNMPISTLLWEPTAILRGSNH